MSSRAPLTQLDHLDGLRGLAALYVVLFHAVLGFRSGPEAAYMKAIVRIFSFGHEAVAVFIVLSGYCLTLSATKRGTRALSVHFGSFIQRRAHRILPPYYAALGTSMALIALVPALGDETPTHTIWDDSHPAFSASSVLSHILLVHNWFPETVHTINGPLWSVATEWQIYALLPAVFVPLRKRFGSAAMLAAGFVLGYGPLFVWPTWSRTAVSWYVALFALGVCAALVHASERPTERELGARVPWPWVAAGSTGVTAVAGLLGAKIWFSWQPWTDLAVGFCTATVLIAATEASLRGRLNGPLALLENRATVRLGRISYSLYLTHLPILALVAAGLRAIPASPWLYRIGMTALGTGTSIVVALLFYSLVERRFLNSPTPKAPSRVPTG